MKLIKAFISIVFLLFFSCKKENIIKTYYSNGNIQVIAQVNDDGVGHGLWQRFYEDGTLKELTYFANGVMNDTLYSYHKNGVIASKGLVSEDMPLGWWSYYDLQGDLVGRREKLLIKGKLFLNQDIKYKNNKIDYDNSSFFDLDIKDTLYLGRNIGEITYRHDTIGYLNKFYRIIIDNKYSEELIKKDTFGGYDDKNKFGIYCDKEGKKVISGMIVRQLFYKNSKASSEAEEYIINTSEKYFNKEVYVKKN